MVGWLWLLLDFVVYLVCAVVGLLPCFLWVCWCFGGFCVFLILLGLMAVCLVCIWLFGVPGGLMLFITISSVG